MDNNSETERKLFEANQNGTGVTLTGAEVQSLFERYEDFVQIISDAAAFDHFKGMAVDPFYPQPSESWVDFGSRIKASMDE